MRPSSVDCYLLGCLIWLANGGAAHSQEAIAVSLTEPVQDDFNDGDWYTIDVERDGVAKQFEGEFIKSNDQWIILRRISEGRNDVDVPVLAKIPVLGPRVFRRVEVGRLTRFLWIPRDAATITGRVRVADPRPPADISDEAPR